MKNKDIFTFRVPMFPSPNLTHKTSTFPAFFPAISQNISILFLAL